MSSFFIPGMLPILIDRLRGDNQAANGANAADAARHSREIDQSVHWAVAARRCHIRNGTRT